MEDTVKTNSSGYANGPSLWLHAGEQADIAALNYLSHRLLQMDSGAIIVITSSFQNGGNLTQETGIHHIDAPSDSGSSVQDFLNVWRPHTLIWAGGNLRPTLLRVAAQSGVRMVLVNSKATDFKPKGFRILPDVTRKTLRLFSELYAVDELAATQLNRMGVTPNRIKLKGHLQSAAAMPIASNEITEELLSTLTGRTLWLAACVSSFEAKVAFEAHQLVMQRDHRSLLLLVPSKDTDQQIFLRMAEAAGLRAACGAEGALPNAMTQVYIAGSYESLTACYRLSPVAFLGQSMDNNARGLDPFVPAAFGCALLYGPNVSDYEERYSGLAKRGAARMISNTDTLAQAISQISNPEQSAKMALAAWEMISEGAELTDALVEKVLDHYDEMGRPA
jgi:3-deoxy-D-manno-octulosonic-acid transferase